MNVPWIVVSAHEDFSIGADFSECVPSAGPAIS